jgi:carbon-monoxide dehydrogenase large subunit
VVVDEIPHILRTYVATTLHLPENRVRVIAPEVGGGFGSKADIYAEDMLAAHLAIRLRRPVKWVEDRRENFVATIHGRDQIQDVELTAKRDGTITGLRARVLADMGAYYQFFTPGFLPSPGFSPLVVTSSPIFASTCAESSPIRLPQMPTVAPGGRRRHIIERMIDLLARELNMDQ